MRKRVFLIILILVCLVSASSLADGMPLSLDRLPLCYQYPIVGSNIIYSDSFTYVYAEPSTDSTVIGHVRPYQDVHFDHLDASGTMAYIFYASYTEQTKGNTGDRSVRGWVEKKYVSFLEDYENRWVVTTDKPGDRLNLRTKPWAESLSLGKYYAGTIVWQQAKPQNGYLKVKIGHMVGYMDMRFLDHGLYTPDAELPLLQVVGTGGAVMHKLPENDSEIIKTAPYGAYVTVLAVRDDKWVQIMFENEIGFAVNSAMTPKLDF